MKNFITGLILALIFVVGFYPALTAEAAWWNPFSWKVFNVPEIDTQTLENRINELEEKVEDFDSDAVDNQLPALEKETGVKESVSEPKVIEKIVEKPIIVKDPLLQAQVNKLLADNKSLQEQISRLTGLNDASELELNTCRRELSEQQSSSSDSNAEIVSALKDVVLEIVRLVQSWDTGDGNWGCHSDYANDSLEGLEYKYRTKNTIEAPQLPNFNRNTQCNGAGLGNYQNRLWFLYNSFQ